MLLRHTNLVFGLLKSLPVSFRLRHNFPDDHAHHRRTIKQQEAGKEIDKALSAGAIEINFSEYIQSELLSQNCPIKNVYVNNLPANSPPEDRWNIGFIQVDGVVSSCLFTMLDGHSGTSCVDALAWSVLDYVAAAFLNKEKLMSADEFLQSHGPQHPYHLARRLDLLASIDHRRLGHAVGPPPPHLATYLRGCLHEYIKELLTQTDRDMDPERCLTEALIRVDNDLCSTNRSLNLFGEDIDTATSALMRQAPLSRELLRIAVSGAVGIVGHIFWDNGHTNSSGKQCHPSKIHLANVGDSRAVILRNCEVNGRQGLEAVQLTTVHQASTNEAEVDRILSNHPTDKVDSIFRNGGRLLGELQPSRAFGNVRYKWPKERLQELSNILDRLSRPSFGSKRDAATHLHHPFPPSDLLHSPWPYTTPPYLTAMPEVTTVELTPADRYLVIATDGLWDSLTPDDLAGILSSKSVIPSSPTGQPSDGCENWRSSPATQLLWKSLTRSLPIPKMGTGREIEQAYHLLSVPAGPARFYRDDIAIMVIELTDQNA